MSNPAGLDALFVPEEVRVQAGLKSLLAPGGRIVWVGAPVRGPGTPEQHAIGPGSCFVSTPGPDFPVIYGWVWIRQAHIEALRADGEVEPRELEAELAWREYRHTLGFRWGTCFSVAEPEGENGETHVSTCREISQEEFEAARLRGWA